MSGRPVRLNAAKGGIDRQRTKGGASPNTLYMLLNGYVTASGAIESRDGTSPVNSGLANTRGLVAHNGGLVVFTHQQVSIPASNPPVSAEILVNRNDPTQPIKEVHFAAAFLGYLYVAAEYNNGDVIHYWLRSVDAWQAGKAYTIGDVVRPNTPNGFTYTAQRVSSAYPTWQPNVSRVTGEKVEPTTGNSYYYEVTNTVGDAPRSGTIEPTWPAITDSVVYEDVDLGTTSNPNPNASSGTGETLPSDVDDRYGNSSGPRCPHVDAWVVEYRRGLIRAGDVLVGDRLLLADPGSLEDAWGEVTYSELAQAPGVRIGTESGLTLTCSDTAPIPVDGGYRAAPDTLHHAVPMRELGRVIITTVVHVGLIPVQHITVGDRCFWVGDMPDGLFLHHNIKMVDEAQA
ncbi:hypothetical protein [Pseudoxanthomonas sp. X-1]|uniref:hypothetical protein n=1 Tax=Pseudoxanthomonas sp. X-1 TaxID=2571115 RepID=UPI0019809367|nr:hypothetical protein [Pseudoxanthomonas sp. X-1]UAY76027.1 hypothetical protein LAJ50_07270 [Pseudoxanthomonas sp. X-1]